MILRGGVLRSALRGIDDPVIQPHPPPRLPSPRMTGRADRGGSGVNSSLLTRATRRQQGQDVAERVLARFTSSSEQPRHGQSARLGYSMWPGRPKKEWQRRRATAVAHGKAVYPSFSCPTRRIAAPAESREPVDLVRLAQSFRCPPLGGAQCAGPLTWHRPFGGEESWRSYCHGAPTTKGVPECVRV